MISLSRFQRRIPPIKNNRYRSAIWRSFNIAWSSALLFLLIFDCHLIAYIRDRSNLGVRCGNAKAVELCLAAVETLVNVAVAVIPISWLANKLINPKRKSLLVVACVFFCVMSVNSLLWSYQNMKHISDVAMIAYVLRRFLALSSLQSTSLTNGYVRIPVLLIYIAWATHLMSRDYVPFY